MRPEVEKAPKSKKQKTEVQKMDDNTYLVSGSTGTIYEVTRDEQVSSGWFCRSTKNNDACMGWKFSKEKACKHVRAVKSYVLESFVTDETKQEMEESK